MLNEIAEYKMYTNLDLPCERIKLAEERGKVAGLKRAMVIVARGIIFNEIFPGGLPDDISREDIERIKERIKDWEITQLKPFVEKTAGNDEESAAKMLNATSILDSKDDEDDEVNKITYDKIIAQAFIDGPLRELFLVATNLNSSAELSNIRVYSKANDTTSKKVIDKEEVKNKNGNNQRNCFLRLLAAYLINRKPGCEWNLIVYSDLKLWGTSKTKKIDLSYYKYFWGTGKERRSVFEKNAKDSYCKFRFDQDWLDECGWKLVDAEELHKMLDKNPETVYFGDDGTQLVLRMVTEEEVME